ncbi:unnamed protein product [Rhodiola kirilowii]
MSIKLDMSKAYDRIEWRFLEKMMAAMGFAEVWIKRIMLCVSTVSYKVKINDDISEIIRPERGLRQGIKICRGAPIISNLMFADDCLLFIKSTKNSVSWIRNILKRYEAVSVQKVNLSKSEVVCSKAVPEAFRQELVERMGREVLIKSVLQAIPNYAMACFKIPVTLCRKLVGDCLKFWWNNSKNRGIHWIKAEELFKDKNNGGMGFRKWELMNMAMLAKQGWRLLTEPDLLFTRLFKAKYFPDSDFLSAGLGSRPSYAWRGINEVASIVRYGAEWDSREGKYQWRRDGAGSFSVKGLICVPERWRESETHLKVSNLMPGRFRGSERAFGG